MITIAICFMHKNVPTYFVYLEFLTLCRRKNNEISRITNRKNDPIPNCCCCESYFRGNIGWK